MRKKENEPFKKNIRHASLARLVSSRLVCLYGLYTEHADYPDITTYLGPEVYEEFMEHYSPCRERAREAAVLLDKTFGCHTLPLKVQ